KRVARALIKDGRIVRGFLGVMIQPLSRDMARKFGLERPEGALIADVLEGGASERAGVRRGDVVLRFNGSRVRNVPELQRLAAFAAPGTRVVLEVQRAGRRVSLPLVMGRLQDASAAPRRSRPASAKSPYGLTVDDLSQEMLEDLARRGVKGGVHVTGVLPNSRAAADGLRVGDVIAEVENRPVADETSFREALQDGPRDVLVLIYRTGRSLFRVLHAPR
ncbi:MAG: PDZ domain-containing protein, partial [Nitrospinota bacterium]